MENVFRFSIQLHKVIRPPRFMSPSAAFACRIRHRDTLRTEFIRAEWMDDLQLWQASLPLPEGVWANEAPEHAFGWFGDGVFIEAAGED